MLMNVMTSNLPHAAGLNPKGKQDPHSQSQPANGGISGQFDADPDWLTIPLILYHLQTQVRMLRVSTVSW